MSILITYTCIAKQDTTLEELEKYVIIFKNKIFDQYVEKKYSVEKFSFGLHKNANRNHFHLGHLLNVNGKTLGHWDKHLRTLIHLADLNKTFSEKIDIKTTYNDKWEAMDATNVLAYPLKEYTNFSEIREIKQFVGLGEKEIENLRDYAHQIYLTKRYEKKCSEEKEVIEKETVESKYKYLDLELGIESIENRLRIKSDQFTYKLKRIITLLLQYEKKQYIEKQKRTFRTSCMLDLAISYLYFKELASEDEIIDYKIRN